MNFAIFVHQSYFMRYESFSDQPFCKFRMTLAEEINYGRNTATHEKKYKTPFSPVHCVLNISYGREYQDDVNIFKPHLVQYDRNFLSHRCANRMANNRKVARFFDERCYEPGEVNHIFMYALHILICKF